MTNCRALRDTRVTWWDGGQTGRRVRRSSDALRPAPGRVPKAYRTSYVFRSFPVDRSGRPTWTRTRTTHKTGRVVAGATLRAAVARRSCSLADLSCSACARRPEAFEKRGAKIGRAHV